LEAPKNEKLTETRQDGPKLTDFNQLIQHSAVEENGVRLDPKKAKLYSKGRKPQAQNQNIYIQNVFGEGTPKQSIKNDIKRSFTPLPKSQKDQEIFKSSIQSGRYDPRSQVPKQNLQSSSFNPNNKGNSLKGKEKESLGKIDSSKKFDNDFDPFKNQQKKTNYREDQYEQRIGNFNQLNSSIQNFNSGVQLPGSIRLLNGSMYNGQLDQGVPNGQGSETLPNGDYYEGDYRSGQRHGEGIFKKRGDFEYFGMFRYGQFHGKGVKTFSNGQIFEGEFKDGKEEGYGELRDANGRSVKKGLWVNGSFAS
jgi:hypothetical protein